MKLGDNKENENIDDAEEKTETDEPSYKGWGILILLPFLMGIFLLNGKDICFSFVISYYIVLAFMGIFYIDYAIKDKAWVKENVKDINELEPEYKGLWVLLCWPGLVGQNILNGYNELISFSIAALTVLALMGIYIIPYKIKHKKWLSEKIKKTHNKQSSAPIVVAKDSVITIKYLETKQLVILTANKEKEAENISFENINSSLMRNLLGRKEGEILDHWLDNETLTKVKIIKIE